jgi:nitroreductase
MVLLHLCLFCFQLNEEIGACFMGAFQGNKVSEILELPKDVRPIGIICIGCPSAQLKPEKLERIDVKAVVHYEKYGSSNSV